MTRSGESWIVERSGWDPGREGWDAALFTQGNGVISSRGAWELLPQGLGTHGTFAAGIFADRPGEVRELVRMPDWSAVDLRFAPDGGDAVRLGGEDAPPSALHRRLDLRAGVLRSEAVFDLGDGGRIRVDSRRFVSLDSGHRLSLVLRVSVESGPGGSMEIGAGWNGDIDQGGFRHLHPVRTGTDGDDAWLLAQTRTGRYTVGCAARLEIEEPGRPPRSAPARCDASFAGAAETVEIGPGAAGVARLQAAIFTSRDDVTDPVAAAVAEVRTFAEAGEPAELARHSRGWADFWGDVEIEIDGNTDLERAVRFGAFHLRGAACPDDPRASIGAKGLCAGYRGHVFWDTEIFMLPMFVATRPEIARSLLTYRYVTLPGARRRAASEARRGARYPWESTDTGDEACPETAGVRIEPESIVHIFDGKEQIHVTADVAHAVVEYVATTGDTGFLDEYGAEILFETARFWVSRVDHLEGRDLCSIKQVIGPDEGHQGVDDNVYTNVMARRNLVLAARAARGVAERSPGRWRELRGRLGLDWEEVAGWDRLAERIVVLEPDEDGFIEQFRGYRSMPDIPDYEEWMATTSPEERRSQWIPYGTQLLKQPDLVMLFALFPDRYDRRVREVNLDYYEPRTTHRSSLGMAIHAIVNFDLDRRDRGLGFLERAAAVDLDNGMGNAHLGIHTAAAGGVWYAVVRGLAGVRRTDEGFSVEPRLPAGIGAVRFRLRFRGSAVRFDLGPERVAVRLEDGDGPVKIVSGDRSVDLTGASPEIAWR